MLGHLIRLGSDLLGASSHEHLSREPSCLTAHRI